MTGIERDVLIDEFFERVCRPLLLGKGEEYAVDGDVNGNFKRVARKTGQTVLQVWFTHFTKHIDAIENWAANPKRDMVEGIESRIADAVNYLLILKTLIEQEKKDASIGTT